MENSVVADQTFPFTTVRPGFALFVPNIRIFDNVSHTFTWIKSSGLCEYVLRKLSLRTWR